MFFLQSKYDTIFGFKGQELFYITKGGQTFVQRILIRSISSKLKNQEIIRSITDKTPIPEIKS